MCVCVCVCIYVYIYTYIYIYEIYIYEILGFVTPLRGQKIRTQALADLRKSTHECKAYSTTTPKTSQTNKISEQLRNHFPTS